MSYRSPLLEPTQSEYHIPRSYLKPKDNLIVVLEEEQGTNITGVEFLIVDRDTICSHISENYPPPVKFFSRKGSTVSAEDAKPGAYLTCPDHKEIVAVEFADYGNPWGACGTFFSGNCTTPVAKKVVEKYCLGKTSCTVPMAATAQLKKKMFCPGSDVKKTNHHSLIL